MSDDYEQDRRDDLYQLAKNIERNNNVCGAIKHVRVRFLGKIGLTPLLVLVHDSSVHEEPEHVCAMDGTELAYDVRREMRIHDNIEIVVIDLDEHSEDWASGDYYDHSLDLPEDPADSGDGPENPETKTIPGPDGKAYRLLSTRKD